MTQTMIAAAEKNAAHFEATLGYHSNEARTARRRVENLKDRAADAARERAEYEAARDAARGTVWGI